MAIKKVGAKNFEETILTKRALREIKLLKHLNGHENVAAYIDVDINDTTNKFTELYYKKNNFNVFVFTKY